PGGPWGKALYPSTHNMAGWGLMTFFSILIIVIFVIVEKDGSVQEDDIETLNSIENVDSEPVASTGEPKEVDGKPDAAPTSKSKSSNLDNYDYTNYVCQETRHAPPTYRLNQGDRGYVLTETRLKQIRSEFLYCFFDKGGDDGNGDYQHDIHSSIPQIHKNFNFQLPFFGFRFNYTR
ncbi:hypothetical protein L9F63_009967, partial [Diploptera punctata]